MPWHVQFRKNDVDHVTRHVSPEAAIVAACRLIDNGHEVYAIGTGQLSNAVGADVIARIYAMHTSNAGMTP